MRSTLIFTVLILGGIVSAHSADFPSEAIFGDLHAKVLGYDQALKLDKNLQSCVMVNHTPALENASPALERIGFPVLVARLDEGIDVRERGRHVCRELGFKDISRSVQIFAGVRGLTGKLAWALNLDDGQWDLKELSETDSVYVSITCTTSEDASICNSGDPEDQNAPQYFFLRWDEIIWNAKSEVF